MPARFRVGGLSAYVASALFLASTAQARANAAGWTSFSTLGLTEYWIESGRGTDFYISCDIEASAKTGATTAIVVLIGNRDPEPGSRVTIMVDNDAFAFDVSSISMIPTDCATCAATFKALWTKLRAAHSMSVRYADGQSASFSLDGIKAVLPATPCKTGFDD
jgi:hypothetical protein